MQNQFQQTFAPAVGTSKFDLGHEFKYSTKIGPLDPVMCVECLPGDYARLNSEFAVRFQALLSPLMHRVNIYTYSFFVPSRLIWKNFKYWICGQLAPQENGNLVAPTEPTITIDENTWQYFQKSSLADYLGIPPIDHAPAQPVTISALPFRAYQCIYDEYFRNQDVEPSLKYVSYSDADTTSLTERYGMTRRKYKNWEKDYFTSMFTEPQQGDPVTIPLTIEGRPSWVPGATFATLVSGLTPGSGDIKLSSDVSTLNPGTAINPGDTTISTRYLQDASGNRIALYNEQQLDFSKIINGNTIADLYQAQRIQAFLSLSKRGGERYIEQIKAHFGVTSSDARLQRPQFLGGGKQPVTISEVMQTAPTENTVVGEYAGRALSYGSKHGFSSYFCEEHGFIITLACVIPRSSYQQGIHKMWSRRDRFDYYWPMFANLQEQPVALKELYVNYDNQKYNDSDTSIPQNDDVIGYQARFMEYRQMHSRVSGEFRDTLSYWHMGRIFDRPPKLNKNFVGTENSTDTFLRPFAIQDGTDYVYVDCYHDLRMLRKMPKYVYPKF